MADEQTIVYLGNRAAIVTSRDTDGRLVRKAMPEANRCTTVTPPPGTPLGEVFTTITAPGSGVWAYHSDAPPAWVASTDTALAQLLAAHYGCEVRDPEPEEG